MHNKQIHVGFAARITGMMRFALASAAFALLLMPAMASFLSYIGVAGGATVSAAAAAPPPKTCQDAKDKPAEGEPQLPPCLEKQTNTIDCDYGSCIFQDYINPAVKTVSALVGIGVTISIIIGGIQYATSADSPQKVSAAKTRIVRSIFILLAYFFFLAFLNWAIPGGVLSNGG